MRFALEILQANDGDCLLLHYEPGGAPPVRILIDGGSRGVYKSVIKPRLDELRGDSRLDLRMAMVSHIDADHITGILDLLRELHQLQDQGEEPFCAIQTLWHNAFKSLHAAAPAGAQSAAIAASLDGQPVAGLDEFTAAVVASVPQGNQLRDHATVLGIPINQGANGTLVMAPDQGQLRVPIAPGLTFSVLAPHKAQIDALQKAWAEAKDSHPASPAAQAADYLNKTVPNMSSIVVLAEAEEAGQPTRRMLLTGDARGDVILEALEAAGLSQQGQYHVDLLKVQHHGSNHSTTQDFFERVTADRYVISGNGAHGIPHGDALGWLSKARHDKPYEAYLTNRIGIKELKGTLDTFLGAEQNEPQHVYHFRPDAARSITIEL